MLDIILKHYSAGLPNKMPVAAGVCDPNPNPNPKSNPNPNPNPNPHPSPNPNPNQSGVFDQDADHLHKLLGR